MFDDCMAATCEPILMTKSSRRALLAQAPTRAKRQRPHVLLSKSGAVTVCLRLEIRNRITNPCESLVLFLNNLAQVNCANTSIFCSLYDFNTRLISATGEQVVREFYAAWSSFQTRHTFAWLDEFDPRQLPDRRSRRAAEQSNKKKRENARKERSELVRVRSQTVYAQMK